MPSIRNNITALYVVQAANYAIPLLTLPCLTRALGPGGFGRLGFCLAFNAYFTLLADYGFNFSATQEISRQRDNREARSKIFWSTMAVKILLAALGLAILVVCTFAVDRLASDRPLYLLGYVAVIGSILTPGWYFQGTENMAVLSGITVFFRAIAVPLTYMFVTGPDRLFAALAINVAPAVMAGLACIALLAHRREIDLVSVSIHDLRRTLQDGWHLFVSTAAINLYTTTNVVLLGFVSGNSAVGYFSGAERLAKATSGLTSPVSQAFYPRISRLMEASRPEAFAVIMRLLRFQGWVGLAVCAVIMVAAPLIVNVMYGPAYAETVAVLRWLGPLPLLIGISNVLGVQAMFPLGMKRAVTRILLLVGAVNLFVLYGLASIFGARGAGAAVMLSELMVTVLMILALHSARIPIFPSWSRL